jgi:hypothetical protein
VDDSNDFEYDEGSDVDNWEAEQVFQDEQFEREDDWLDHSYEEE